MDFKSQASRRPIHNALFPNAKLLPLTSILCIKYLGHLRVENDAVILPLSIMSRFESLAVLVEDVMIVCGLPLLIMMSRGLISVTVQFVPCRTAAKMGNSLKSVLHVYRRANISVALVIMDGEFKEVKNHMVATMADFNTLSKNEHVGGMEHEVRVIKVRTRVTKSEIPYHPPSPG